MTRARAARRPAPPCPGTSDRAVESISTSSRLVTSFMLAEQGPAHKRSDRSAILSLRDLNGPGFSGRQCHAAPGVISRPVSHHLGSCDASGVISRPVLHHLGSCDASGVISRPVLHHLGSCDALGVISRPVLHHLGSCDALGVISRPVLHHLGSCDAGQPQLAAGLASGSARSSAPNAERALSRQPPPQAAAWPQPRHSEGSSATSRK